MVLWGWHNPLTRWEMNEYKVLWCSHLLRLSSLRILGVLNSILEKASNERPLNSTQTSARLSAGCTTELRLSVLTNHKKASHINKLHHTAAHELESAQHHVRRESVCLKYEPKRVGGIPHD